MSQHVILSLSLSFVSCTTFDFVGYWVGQDVQSVYTDASGISGKNGSYKDKKKKKKKRNGSERSRADSTSSGGYCSSNAGSNSSETTDLEAVAKEFVSIMRGGMRLLAATSNGSTRPVIVVRFFVFCIALR